MSERPEMTERDLSYHVATAGVAAKGEAAEIGGDPAHLRSLVAAAAQEEGSAPKVIVIGNPSAMLGKYPLRQDDLLVTLCLNLYQMAFGADLLHQALGLIVCEKEDTSSGQKIQTLVKGPQAPETTAAMMQAIASLGYIFTQADTAWELLDQATDRDEDERRRKVARSDFLRAALDFGGRFNQQQTDTLLAHVSKLMRRAPAADLGKPDAPAS